MSPCYLHHVNVFNSLHVTVLGGMVGLVHEWTARLHRALALNAEQERDAIARSI
jgi:hypothetical protein